jgi:hypothetical protein
VVPPYVLDVPLPAQAAVANSKTMAITVNFFMAALLYTSFPSIMPVR